MCAPEEWRNRRCSTGHQTMSVPSGRQEVALMELYVNERRMALPAALAPVSAALAFQAAANGSNGTTGFVGEGIQVHSKRTDLRGVPPRGRPV